MSSAIRATRESMEAGTPAGPSGTAPSSTPTSTRPNVPPIPRDRATPQDLGVLEGSLTRDADSLITHVDGVSVDQRLRDIAAQRTDNIRQMREEGTISAKEAGPVNSVGIDSRTGAVVEGVNGRPTDVIPDDRLHPVLRERVEQMRAAGPYPQYNRDGTPLMRDGQQVMTPFPHGDNPLRHAEVKVVNELLWRRGPDADSSVMSEFRVDNRFPFRQDGPQPAPCCANCHRMLAGTPSNAGRLTQDGGHPDSQFIPE
ncbi:YwqJ-related putative deaminase [Actinokineospora auranticolor]|uniref:YwqJ-like deaminase n=1 Tax=Actinokineospora auranticolor TaxID=155976 RepID=A0A2S6GDK5_9PSEU|nr:YwqJ-related putative deaminase [Actinokineospora auranticolor]PPK63299.1 YwqJ-like deaminase [Actinokineospora auranticolor]